MEDTQLEWPLEKVRQTFVDYFTEREHANVPSSPVIPHNDPTLLFANAGMNQFKPIFLGIVDPNSEHASLKRAANSQKCIRAGGKHNDLEDVGRDTYHHTFFEMLGNWSFGDYFKKEAIAWSLDLLINVYGIDKSRLYATYWEGSDDVPVDNEARDLLLAAGIPKERVLPFGKDNFWEMGDSGPCGPCAELHYDRIGNRDASHLVNADDESVIEIWNLVFMQYNREEDGSLRQLSAQHIDTGMGLERVCSILQGKDSNYDTDAFTKLFKAIEEVTNPSHPYSRKMGKNDTGLVDTSYRIIADHIRCLTFAIADGAIPDAVGRGYVLRRILRRAVRFGKQMLGAKSESGFFWKLVDTMVEQYGPAFPELVAQRDHVINVLKEEEAAFTKTLKTGLRLFSQKVARMRKENPDAKEVTGQVAFELYSTYGFPFDLTELMAKEEGLTVDVKEFDKAMEDAKNASKEASKGGVEEGKVIKLQDNTVELLKGTIPATDASAKYNYEKTLSYPPSGPFSITAEVKAVWDGENFKEKATEVGEADIGVILDCTNFYAESGGQIFDTGRFCVEGNESETLFNVTDVQSFGGYSLHIGSCAKGKDLKIGQKVELHVDSERRGRIMCNHTATHMANFALLKVLPKVEQKGSIVLPDRFRYDFSHSSSLTLKQLRAVEEIVNRLIKEELEVEAREIPLEIGKQINNLRIIPGEVYPDPVRVLSIGAPIDDLVKTPEDSKWADYSIEFCGGSHLSNTKAPRKFCVLSQEQVSKGVRRITCITGKEAEEAASRVGGITSTVAALSSLSGDALETAKVEAIKVLEAIEIPLADKLELKLKLKQIEEKIKEQKKQQQSGTKNKAEQIIASLIEKATAADGKPLAEVLDIGFNSKVLSDIGTKVSTAVPSVNILLTCGDKKKTSVLVICSGKGISAVDWAKKVAEAFGGKGGGKPTKAQGAFKAADLQEVVTKARQVASEL